MFGLATYYACSARGFQGERYEIPRLVRDPRGCRPRPYCPRLQRENRPLDLVDLPHPLQDLERALSLEHDRLDVARLP